MKALVVILALCISFWQTPEPTKRSQAAAVVTELRATKRLPAWANYVCYSDDRSLKFEEVSLIAYQPYGKLSQMEKDAIKLGYVRSITFQWYMVFDSDIRAMNLPPSPEEFSAMAGSVKAGSTIDGRQYTLLLEHALSEQNAIAQAKAARKDANASDEQTLALLDGPDGTAYKTYLRSHPEFRATRLYVQKYINMGIASIPSEPFVVYTEGSLLFDVEGVGSFETPAGVPIRSRIALSDTDSGLRYVRTSIVDGKTLGIPFAGVCDPL